MSLVWGVLSLRYLGEIYSDRDVEEVIGEVIAGFQRDLEIQFQGLLIYWEVIVKYYVLYIY